MNASEMLRLYHDGTGLVLTEDGESTILRALRLLAAAEANDGSTPETDARVDYEIRAGISLGESAIYDIARTLEMERNGLAARVAELEQTERDLRRIIERGRESSSKELELSALCETYRNGAAKLLDRAESAERKLAELEKRLEIDPRHSYDGIAARDETIRLQDEELKRLRERLVAIDAAGTEDVRAALARIDGWSVNGPFTTYEVLFNTARPLLESLSAKLAEREADSNVNRLSAETWESKYWNMRERAEKAEAELARVKAELLGVKEYRERNPLGGPAKVFDAMADQIRAGDDFNKVIADYGWCPVDRAERAEAALAESERKQAQIDALMLEYCPDEMTEEQLANWGKHQRPLSKEESAEMDATMKGSK